jgi:hypothetical protein
MAEDIADGHTGCLAQAAVRKLKELGGNAVQIVNIAEFANAFRDVG